MWASPTLTRAAGDPAGCEEHLFPSPAHLYLWPSAGSVHARLSSPSISWAGLIFRPAAACLRNMPSCSSSSQEPPPWTKWLHRAVGASDTKETMPGTGLAVKGQSNCQLNVLQGDPKGICILWTSHREKKYHYRFCFLLKIPELKFIPHPTSLSESWLKSNKQTKNTHTPCFLMSFAFSYFKTVYVI